MAGHRRGALEGHGCASPLEMNTSNSGSTRRCPRLAQMASVLSRMEQWYRALWGLQDLYPVALNKCRPSYTPVGELKCVG